MASETFYTLTREDPVIQDGECTHNEHVTVFCTSDSERAKGRFQEIPENERYNYYVEIYQGHPDRWDSELLGCVGGEDLNDNIDLI